LTLLGALTLAVIEHVLIFPINHIQGDGLKGNTEWRRLEGWRSQYQWESFADLSAAVHYHRSSEIKNTLTKFCKQRQPPRLCDVGSKHNKCTRWLLFTVSVFTDL
jgi:hypothetical protein